MRFGPYTWNFLSIYHMTCMIDFEFYPWYAIMWCIATCMYVLQNWYLRFIQYFTHHQTCIKRGWRLNVSDHALSRENHKESNCIPHLVKYKDDKITTVQICGITDYVVTLLTMLALDLKMSLPPPFEHAICPHNLPVQQKDASSVISQVLLCL